jgi:hypothetical protein
MRENEEQIAAAMINDLRESGLPIPTFKGAVLELPFI